MTLKECKWSYYGYDNLKSNYFLLANGVLITFKSPFCDVVRSMDKNLYIMKSFIHTSSMDFEHLNFLLTSTRRN